MRTPESTEGMLVNSNLGNDNAIGLCVLGEPTRTNRTSILQSTAARTKTDTISDLKLRQHLLALIAGP